MSDDCEWLLRLEFQILEISREFFEEWLRDLMEVGNLRTHFSPQINIYKRQQLSL